MKPLLVFALLLVCCVDVLARIPSYAAESESFHVSTKPYLIYNIVNFIQSLFGIFLNALSLYLFLRTDKKKIDQYVLILALNISDIAICDYIGARSVVNFSFPSEFYGGQLACQIDAFIKYLFALYSIYIIVCISYVTRIELTRGTKIVNKQTKQMAIFSLIYALFFLITSTMIIDTQLSTAGRCLYVLSSNNAKLLQIPMLYIPIAFLIYNLYSIRASLNKSQQKLTLDGIKSRAKAKYAHMNLKLFYFILSILTATFPAQVYTIYESQTKSKLPTHLAYSFSIVIIFSNSFINPLLFIYLNYDLQVTFWNDFGPYLNWILVFYNSSLRIHASTVYESEANVDYDKWETWMSDPSLLAVFQKHSDQNYVSESLLFYNDIEEFKFRVLESGDIDINEINFINERVNKFYSLYIQVPNAPLEINISAGMRKRIEEKFEKKASGEYVYDARKSIVEGKWEECNLFKESQEEIGRIIESDIFPRFSKSKEFHSAVKSRKKEMNEVLKSKNVFSMFQKPNNDNKIVPEN